MLIMSKTFPCISVLACSNSWARQHFVSKIKPLATMSTNFPASSLALNQSIPNPSAAFTRQGTSNRQLKHLTHSFKPLATMSTNFPASSLALNQSIPNPSAAFTRQGTSNRQPKHLSHSLTTDSANQPIEMDDPLYYNFPTNLKKGSKTEARNGKIYQELPNGVKYIDIYTGDGEEVKKDDKYDIEYKIYDKAGIYKGRSCPKKFPSANLDTGLQEGIEGMKSGGRRIITIPPNLPHQFAKGGEYAIYDVIMCEIHSG